MNLFEDEPPIEKKNKHNDFSKKSKSKKNNNHGNSNSDSSSDSDQEGGASGRRGGFDGGFSVNKEYAENYEKKKKGEELSKLRDKYGESFANGSDSEGSSSESLSTDDSDAEFLTPQVDVAILKTLVRIKRGDEGIYESGREVFDEEENSLQSTTFPSKPQQQFNPKSKSKPVHLKDYQMKALLSLNGKDEDNEENGGNGPLPPSSMITPAQEADLLRSEVTKAFHDAVDDDDDRHPGEDDGLLYKKSKSKSEKEQEEEDYKSFLARSLGMKGEEGELMKSLRGLFSNDDDDERGGSDKKKGKTKLLEEEGDEAGKGDGKRKGQTKGLGRVNGRGQDGETFLTDYILNRRWIDPSSSKHIPSYSQIVGEEEEKSQKKKRRKKADLDGIDDDEDEMNLEDDDEEFEELADDFESRYNFRYQEDAGASLVTHSRSNPTSVRHASTLNEARKRARELREKRKEEEREEKKREMKRLRELKKEEEDEMRKKVEREVWGKKNNKGKAKEVDRKELAGLSDLDFDEDFDPEDHDRKMQSIFGSNWYNQEDEDGKPIWDDDIDISHIEEEEDQGFEPGGDSYDPTGGGADDERGKKKTKRAKKNEKKKAKKLAKGGGEEVAAAGSLGDEEDKDLAADFEYEDLIGGMPTRFHYTETLPISTDLTPAEILLATDAELNEYMGVKKLAPYRSSDSDSKGTKKRKKKLKELRERIAKRRWGQEWRPEDEEQDEERRQKERAKKRKRHGGEDGNANEPPKKRKGKSERKREKEAEAEAEEGKKVEIQE